MEALRIIFSSTYSALFVLCVLYAALLQATRRWWERRFTWVTVVFGVALVGLVLRWRYTQAPTDLDGQALLLWAWWEMVYHFGAAAIPIIAWQLWQDRIKIMHTLDYRRNAR